MFPLDTPAGFAYAHKDHAEAGEVPNPTLQAIPRVWAKHLPKTDYAE